MNSNPAYINVLWVIDCRRWYLDHSFSGTKDEALQESWRVNSNLVYINALWVVDYCWCYLNHSFSGTKDEALQESWRVNSKLVYINVLWAINCFRWRVNNSLVYVNAFWVVYCCWCYPNHSFSAIKDEALHVYLWIVDGLIDSRCVVQLICLYLLLKKLKWKNTYINTFPTSKIHTLLLQ